MYKFEFILCGQNLYDPVILGVEGWGGSKEGLEDEYEGRAKEREKNMLPVTAFILWGFIFPLPFHSYMAISYFSHVSY